MQSGVTVAVVLAGGASRRMGRDKATLEWGGRPLLEHILLRLRGAFEQLVVVGGCPEWVTLPEAQWMPDDQPGAGAAAAILTALRRLQRPCFVCACDMPWVHAELGRWLLQHGSDSAIHVPRWQGRVQPLHAAWFPKAAIPLQTCLREGERALQRILLRLERAGTLKLAEETVVKRFDPDGRCFLNLNTPSEWHRWEKLVEGGEALS